MQKRGSIGKECNFKNGAGTVIPIGATKHKCTHTTKFQEKILVGIYKYELVVGIFLRADKAI